MKKNTKLSESIRKKTLVAFISEISGLSKTISIQVLDETIRFITQSLKDGNDVKLSGFGTFKIYNRPASEGRNPRTRERVKIPAKKLPKFRASPMLKAEIY